MKAHEIHRKPDIRDEPPTEGDRYARESFTWRRMQPWQIWTAAIAAGALIITGLVLLY